MEAHDSEWSEPTHRDKNVDDPIIDHLQSPRNRRFITAPVGRTNSGIRPDGCVDCSGDCSMPSRLTLLSGDAPAWQTLRNKKESLLPLVESSLEGRLMGLEPTTTRSTIWCSAIELQTPYSRTDYFTTTRPTRKPEQVALPRSGWGTGIRTPIDGSKVRSPAVRRSPTSSPIRYTR